MSLNNSNDDVKSFKKKMKKTKKTNTEFDNSEFVKKKTMKMDASHKESPTESLNKTERVSKDVAPLNDDVDDDDDPEYAAVKEEMSQMTFEELQKLRDRLGMKAYNRAFKDDQPKKRLSMHYKFTRENRNRPREMSSKKRTSSFREVVDVKKKINRDPRFDELSGTFNETVFKKSYSFLTDVKEREKEDLFEQLKDVEEKDEAEKIKFLLNRMKQQEMADKQRERKKEIEEEWKMKERTRVEDGKTPHFLKKGDLRLMELAEQYKTLKKSGKLDKYLIKKRKKNASKERRKIPIL